MCSDSAVASPVFLGEGRVLIQQQEILRCTAYCRPSHVFDQLSLSYSDLLFEHIGFLPRFTAWNTFMIFDNQFDSSWSNQKGRQDQLDGLHTQSEWTAWPIKTEADHSNQ